MFYDKLEQICKQNGISPSRMAVELKLSKSAVTRWKRGEGITNTTLKKISDYFGVPIGYFLDDDASSTEKYTKKEVVPVGTASRDEQSDYIMRAHSSMPKDMLDNIEEICRLYNNDPGTDNQKLVNAIRSLLDLNK